MNYNMDFENLTASLLEASARGLYLQALGALEIKTIYFSDEPALTVIGLWPVIQNAVYFWFFTSVHTVVYVKE